MKEKSLFWLLTALFVISCVCILLISALNRQSNAVYVVDISASTSVSSEIILSDPPVKAPSVQISTSSPPVLIDINTASKDELITLPGVGEVIAESIITYREENGGFDTIEEIMEVSGIGDGRFAAIKDLIIV